jgi:uncharacterized protein YjbI with pentapeptide repeats
MSNGTPSAEESSLVEKYLAWEPTVWPTDVDARRRISEFLGEFREQLRTANPTAIELRGVELDLRGGDFSDAPWAGAWLNLAKLDGVRLQNAWLNGAHLEGSSLRQADLTAADLRDADLSHADVEGANFERADLREMRAHETNLRGARFAGADLTRAGFYDADLRGADFRGSTFKKWLTVDSSRLSGARFDDLAGQVLGPADISETDEPHVVGGAELQAWFGEHGAPDLTVIEE